jgi:signal transduction histidine kinase
LRNKPVLLTIGQRLLLTFTSITIVGGLALLYIAIRQLQTSTLEFYQRDVETEALTTAGTLGEPAESFFATGSDDDQTAASGTNIQRLFARIDPDRHLIFIDATRRVLADSKNTYTLFERMPDSPEIEAALGGQVARVQRLDENGDAAIYVAAPVRFDENLLGVLLLSAPMEPAYTRVRQATLDLATAVLPVILVTIIASLWLGRNLSHPIQRLNESALRIAEGALDERIDVRTRDEIGQLAQSFNFMAERLSLMMNAQRSFVSNAAHELRTPLMGLQLRIEGLMDSTLPAEERRAYLSEANEQIRYMAGLVSALLVLARLDENEHPMTAETFDAVALLQDVSRHWRIQAQQSGLDFQAEIPESLPDLPVSSGDLRMVIDNLVGNAIKYTSKGRISLRARMEDHSLHLQVMDTGEGFTPEEGQRLFQRFYRAERARSELVPGTGLGLAIVQAVLARYGGTISGSSQGPGLGSTFEAVVPLGVA